MSKPTKPRSDDSSPEQESMAGHGAMGRGRGRSDPTKRHSPVEIVSSSGSGTTRQSTDGKQPRVDRRAQPATWTKPAHINSKVGTSGIPIDLGANYFRFGTKKDSNFYQYHVTFEPEVDIVGLRKRYVRLSFPAGGFIYDGGAAFFTTQRLEPLPFRFSGKHENIDFKVVLRQAGNGGPIEKDSEKVPIYNIVLRRAMNELNLEQVGRNLYDSHASKPIASLNLELWPGYITSIRDHEKNILLNCELSHKVMRKDTVYDLMKQKRTRGGDWQNLFKEEIIGKVVLTGYNNKTYKISDVDFNKKVSETFDFKGRVVSFNQYYEEKYKIKIVDTNQPLLVVNPSARDIRGGRTTIVNLVPELCRTTGLTDEIRNNFRKMQEFSRETMIAPNEKANKLIEFSNRLNANRDSALQLESFNMRVDRNLVQFPGRQLPFEKVVFKDSEIQCDAKTDWTMAFRNQKLIYPMELSKWIVICPQDLKVDVDNFIRLKKQVSNSMGFKLGDPKFEWLKPRPRKEDYINAIDVWQPKKPQLYFIVVPDDAKDRYDTVKKRTYCTYAIPSQVIKRNTLTSKKGDAGVMSIATKVAIQMSCKIGGAPWTVKMPLKGLMTIGFDVSHGPKQNRFSFGAFVATMDIQQKFKYYSGVIRHNTGEEISHKMADQMQNALEMFKREHGTYPLRIVFYRDGVGESQFDAVKDLEVGAIKKVLKQIDPNDEVHFTFIIVNKRLNTRIFKRTINNAWENPLPGTVVDNTITMPERYDFYLISQNTRQGCVAPTSYNIIADSSNLTPDKIQVLTYKNCYLYYNWSGTMRVPAVVQCAHKLSVLAGEHLNETPHPDLGNMGILYFL